MARLAASAWSPGDPARPVRRLDLLIMDARAVGKDRDRALLQQRQRHVCADQGIAAASGECAEGVVHIGDAAGGVAPHDDVPLCLEKALGVLLGLLDLPFAIGDLLETRFQALDLLLHGALATDHQRERAAGRDRQARQQRQVRMEMTLCKTGAVARHDPIEGGDDRDRSGDGQSGEDVPPGSRTSPLAHVPAKWMPVRRQGHAPMNNPGARPDSAGTGRALGASARVE